MHKVVTFGEIMLRLATPDYLRFRQAHSFDATYGGGEANVAVSLANYGLAPTFVTRLPENDLGDAAIRILKSHGVDISKILRGGDRIGIYFLETGAVSRGSKLVCDRAHSALSAIESGSVDWDAVFDGAKWFHWTGITPAASEILLGVSNNPIIILLIINANLLFVGVFMDMTPAVLVFTPIFLPVAVEIGIDPVHFGIMVVMNLCVGLCTPPVGSVLFVGCGVANIGIQRVI